jgi:hypothetical protein
MEEVIENNIMIYDRQHGLASTYSDEIVHLKEILKLYNYFYLIREFAYTE